MATIVGRILNLRHTLRALWRDAAQRRKYGQSAPKYGEQVWIHTKDCGNAIQAPISRRRSGKVLAGDWDLDSQPVRDLPKIAYCLRHWGDGQSWEDAGAHEFMIDLIRKRGRVDGVNNEQEIAERFARLDVIFKEVRTQGRLLPAHVVKNGGFRECGGVYVHIGRDGQPLFGHGGNHRLAIALALDLPHFPAQLGVVHPDALDRLAGFREMPQP